MAVRAHGHRHHLILPDCALTSRPAPWPNPDVESHEDMHGRTWAAEASADDISLPDKAEVRMQIPRSRTAYAERSSTDCADDADDETVAPTLMEGSRLVASTQIAQPQATSSRTGAAACAGTLLTALQEARHVGSEVLCRGIREGTWTGMWTVTRQGPWDGT